LTNDPHAKHNKLGMENIESLTSTTISGRRFTRKQLTQVKETVERFSTLSRQELALTICEHLNWENPAGKLKVNSCMTLLEHLEKLGIVVLPEKRKKGKSTRRAPAFEKSPDESSIEGSLEDIGPITLQRVSKDDFKEFKAYIQTYHYLGYKHPFGSYIAYFVVSEATKRKVGCLLFSASSAWALEARDKWIGWKKEHRQKLLPLVLSNNRFLIFPWVRVSNLASHILSLATKQIGNDWVSEYKYRPVLIETFVDTTKYSGASYQSANWEKLGLTKGRGSYDPKCERKETIKDIYVYPLTPDWRETLTGCHRASALKKKYRNDVQSSHSRLVDESFVALWEKVAKVIYDLAARYDKKWQVRQRIINSQLIILFVFRLVCSKNFQSYGSTIDELWDSCHRLNLPLPQKGSVAPSSLCTARRKLDANVFKEINQKIIETYSDWAESESYKWLGHRVFAVDGSWVNLPRGLMKQGYRRQSESAYYPQGKLSCLYQLKSQLPYDFDLVSHLNERTCAKQHLHALKSNDVVVYDRGYYSYLMLHQHAASKIHAIFRLQKSNSRVIDDFVASDKTDEIVTLFPSDTTRKEILVEHPGLNITPIPMRLIKYQIGEETVCLGTTLLDQQKYVPQEFIEIYHSRWGIEELYKVSKRIFIIEEFHAQTERGVKQEIFAHFVLVTMNRIFSNQADLDLNLPGGSPADQFGDASLSTPPSSNQPLGRLKTNFKNCIHVVTRSIEELVFLHGRMKTAIERVFIFVKGRHQKERLNRSYQRKSMRPLLKWHGPRKRKKKTPKDQTPAPTAQPVDIMAVP
jgi:hypothetical protein